MYTVTDIMLARCCWILSDRTVQGVPVQPDGWLSRVMPLVPGIDWTQVAPPLPVTWPMKPSSQALLKKSARKPSARTVVTAVARRRTDDLVNILK